MTPSVGTTRIVFSSTCSSMSSASSVVPGDIGTSRISMSQYFANLCHTTWTGAADHVRPVGRACPRPRASPATATWPPCPPTCTPRTSRSRRRRSCWPPRALPEVGQHVHAAPLDLGGLRVLVLVDHVLVDARSMSRGPRGSSHVWQNVARFWRELPSRISSSCDHLEDGVGIGLSGGKRYFGSAVAGACARRAVRSAATDLVTFVQRHRGSFGSESTCLAPRLSARARPSRHPRG